MKKYNISEGPQHDEANIQNHLVARHYANILGLQKYLGLVFYQRKPKCKYAKHKWFYTETQLIYKNGMSKMLSEK